MQNVEIAAVKSIIQSWFIILAKDGFLVMDCQC